MDEECDYLGKRKKVAISISDALQSCLDYNQLFLSSVFEHLKSLRILLRVHRGLAIGSRWPGCSKTIPRVRVLLSRSLECAVVFARKNRRYFRSTSSGLTAPLFCA